MFKYYLLLSSFLLFIVADKICFDTPAIDQSLLVCTDPDPPYTLQPTSAAGFSNMPSSGTPELIISFQVRLTNMCGWDGNQDFFILTLSGSPIINARLDLSDNQYVVSTTDGTNTFKVAFMGTEISGNLDNYLNDWVEVMVSVSLTGSITAGIGTKKNFVKGSRQVTYDPNGVGLQFTSSNTDIYLCSINSHASGFGCEFTNFKMGYTMWSDDIAYLQSPTPTLVSSYAMNDKSGTTVKDSVDSSGSQDATFGDNEYERQTLGTVAAPGPKWSDGTGVQFTDSKQRITVPFTPQKTKVGLISQTLSFWLKLTSTSTSQFYICRTYNFMNDPVYDYFAIKIDDKNGLYLVIGSEEQKSLLRPTLTPGIWQKFIISFLVRASGTSGVASINYQDPNTLQSITLRHTVSLKSKFYDATMAEGVITYLSGLNTQLAHFDFYSYGSAVVFTSSCATTPTGLFDLGLMSASSLVSIPTTCDSTCNGCLDIKPTSCFECAKGKFSEGGICKGCFTNCEVCSDTKTCEKCVIGYQLSQKTACVLVSDSIETQGQDQESKVIVIEKNSSISTGKVVGIVLGSLGFCALLGGAIYLFLAKSAVGKALIASKVPTHEPLSANSPSMSSPQKTDFDTIRTEPGNKI